MLIKCIYCLKTKFSSKEHILCQKLGNKMFVINNAVCRDCNSGFLANLDEDILKNFYIGLATRMNKICKRNVFRGSETRIIENGHKCHFYNKKRKSIFDLEKKEHVQKSTITTVNDEYVELNNLLRPLFKIVYESLYFLVGRSIINTIDGRNIRLFVMGESDVPQEHVIQYLRLTKNSRLKSLSCDNLNEDYLDGKNHCLYLEKNKGYFNFTLRIFGEIELSVLLRNTSKAMENLNDTLISINSHTGNYEILEIFNDRIHYPRQLENQRYI